MKTFISEEEIPLKKFTDNVYPQGAFVLSTLLKKKDVKVNGNRVNKNVDLRPGDEVIYYTTPEQEQEETHYDVYEDDNVLIVDKLSGVVSEGLLSELNGYQKDGQYTAVHRLDRNTQGLMVFAKNAKAARVLKESFKGHLVEKTYLALCVDNFDTDEDKLYAFLKKDADKSLVSVHPEKVEGSERIVTEYQVLERHKGLALVKILLHTGKTHQIRAHLAYIGCPIVGDEKYGDEDVNRKYKVRRQRLVAKKLEFNVAGELSYLNHMDFESRFDPEL